MCVPCQRHRLSALSTFRARILHGEFSRCMLPFLLSKSQFISGEERISAYELLSWLFYYGSTWIKRLGVCELSPLTIVAMPDTLTTVVLVVLPILMTTYCVHRVEFAFPKKKKEVFILFSRRIHWKDYTRDI